MEAREPLTETMQANYLAPQGQPSRSRQTHALEEGLCNTSATQLDRQITVPTHSEPEQ